MHDIDIINDDQLSAPNEQQMIQWASSVLNEHTSGSKTLCISIVDETQSQALNKQYRHKDKPTNVLSFPAEIPESLKLPILGDIIICSNIVVQEAIAHNISTEMRWAHMITHGILHLLGYDHINEKDAEIMENLETGLLTRWGYSDPYTV